ncbi:MAG: DNA replication/repair protein RecF [Actinobacteria bacterium]|nr:DNA replication/repair protein RecF [Actinomycetota bacterium]
MRVDRLVLEDFRNYEREEIDLSGGLNLVVGRNAQGKTNLLEAIYCIGGFGSPRGPDAALVRNGADRALVHADVTRGERTVHVDLEHRPGRGVRALLNGTAVPGMRALRELTASVFFGPDELSLIKGSPEGRRRFLDELVVKLRPARDTIKREWDRVLKQRNALLRSAPRGGGPARSARETLVVWDEAFCNTGAELAAARLEVLAALTPYAAKRYEEIAGGGRLELSYQASWLGDVPTDAADVATLREALANALDEVRPRELERGMSLIGPQRDDVVVNLSSAGYAQSLLDARAYASQGDQRTCALALKLGEHDLLTDALDDHPILLLDDVFSELDPARRAWLADAIRGIGQSVVSSAEPGAAEAADAARVIRVEGGRVIPGVSDG